VQDARIPIGTKNPLGNWEMKKQRANKVKQNHNVIAIDWSHIKQLTSVPKARGW
jgi:hypothetical protein